MNVSQYLLVDQNAGRGIGIESNGSNVDAVTVLNNIVSNSTAGQGIQVDLTGSGLRSVIVDFNTITDSSDRGLDVILDTVTGSSTIAVRNTTAARSGGRGISVEGSTATLGSVTLLNVSSDTTAADEGVGVVFDTNSTVGPIVLNNVSATLSNAGGILVDLNTVAMTGPNAGISVNGLTTAQSTNNGGDGILVNLNTVTGAPDVSVINYLLVDTNVGRGIAVDSNGSTLDDVTVSTNIVSNSTNGQGIQVQLAGSTLDALVVSDNTVSDTTALLIGQGIQIDLTGSTLLTSLVADNNNVTNSADRGIDVILTGTLGSPTITVSDSTATNSGGRGVSLEGVGATLGDVTLTNVSSTLTTADDGVVVRLNGGTVGSVLLDTVSANQSFAGGILVSLLTGENVGPSITLNGQGTATSSNNGGDGILVNLAVNGTPDVTISDYAFVDTNVGRGIALQTNFSAVGAISVSNNVVSNSTAGQGMHLNLTGSQVGSVLVDSNQISDSFGRGLDVVLDGTFGFPGIAISNTTVTISGDRGVSVGGTGALLGDVTLTNVSSDTTRANEGVAIDLDNGTVGSIVMNNVSADASFTTGILVDLNTQTVGPEITLNGMGAGHVIGNGTGVAGDGIWITLNTLNGTPNLTVSDYLSIDTNAGDGVIVQQVAAADVGTVNIANNIINGNTGGNGLLIDLTGSNATDLTIDTNIIGSNRDNGVQLTQNGSNLGAATVSNNIISNHTINGIVVELLNNSDLPTGTFTNNQITLSGGDGFRMVNPNAGGTAIALTFIDNTITTSTGSGVEVQLNNNENVTLNFNSVTTGNQISNNGTAAGATGFGIHLSSINIARYALNVGGAGAIVNTLDGNRNAGIAVEATDQTVGSVSINNTTVNNTLAGGNGNFSGDGFALRIAQQANVTALTIGAGTRNTVFDENAGDGINILTIENSRLTGGMLIQNTSTTDSGSDGISITRRDDSMLSNDISGDTIVQDAEPHIALNNVISTGNNANGLNVVFTNAQLPTPRIDIADTTNNGVADSRFDNNGTGMRFNGSADAVLVLNVSDTSASDNDNGVVITLTEDATIGNMIPGLGNVNNPLSIASTFNGMTISNNGNNGFVLTANNDSLALITMTNTAMTARNTFDANGGNGFQLTSNGQSNVNMSMNAVNILNTTGVVTGDGLNVTTNSTSNMTLALTNAFIGNVIPTTVLPGLTGDGIDITTNASSSLAFTLGADLDFRANTATGLVDVGIYGNSGNGIVIRNNASSSYTGTLNNVASRFNDGRGYSALMTAASTGNGGYAHNIDDSGFGENGREGIAFIANAGTHNQSQNLPLQFSNTDVPIAGQNDRTFPIGDSNDFLNLATDLDASLTLTNSSVRNNGAVVNSNGLVIAVSTNSTVQADVRGNTFSGNSLDDVRTSSFITTDGGFDAIGNVAGTAIQTNASVNRSGAGSI